MMRPMDFAKKAHEKWGQPIDENAEFVVNEMQADMMVLIGLIYGLCTPDDVVVVTKQKDQPND